jgi:hypothetical protein
VKHAGAEALDALEPLLNEVRRAAGLNERKRGIFYRKSKAFLHFHEDPAGMFADVKLSGDGDYARLRVSTAAERKVFLIALKKALAT